MSWHEPRIPKVGLEPTPPLRGPDFESGASAVPPLRPADQQSASSRSNWLSTPSAGRDFAVFIPESGQSLTYAARPPRCPSNPSN